MAGVLAIAGDLLGTLLKAALAGLALVWALQRVLSTPPDSGDTAKKRQRKKKGSQPAAAGEGSTPPAAASGPAAHAKGNRAEAAAAPKPTVAAAAGPAAQAKKAQAAARPKPTVPIVSETESSSEEEEDPAPEPKPIFPPRTAPVPIEAGWEPVRAPKKYAGARPTGAAQGAGNRSGSSSKGGPVDTSKKRGEMRVCERPGCGAEGRGLRKCGRCGKVAYCTPACMQSDWERHQVSCNL